MTIFHFVNCLALGAVPHVILYKFSGLHEYSALWKCIQVAGAYVLTQLCKMLLLATFFPPWTGGLADFLRSTCDLFDLLGLFLVFQRVSGKGSIKILTVGAGWAAAHFLLTKVVPLWVGASGPQFSWAFVRLSFESNLELVQHLVLALLLWLYCRFDLGKAHLPFVTAGILLINYRPFLFQSLAHLLSPGCQVGLHAGLTALVSIVSLVVYHMWSEEINGPQTNGKAAYHLH